MESQLEFDIAQVDSARGRACFLWHGSPREGWGADLNRSSADVPWSGVPAPPLPKDLGGLQSGARHLALTCTLRTPRVPDRNCVRLLVLSRVFEQRVAILSRLVSSSPQDVDVETCRTFCSPSMNFCTFRFACSWSGKRIFRRIEFELLNLELSSHDSNLLCHRLG